MVNRAKLFYGFIFNLEEEFKDDPDYLANPREFFYKLAEKYYGNKKVSVDIAVSPDGYDNNEMYIFAKESIREIDEEQGWAKEVFIPKEQSPFYVMWDNEIRKICEENKIPYREANWHLMVDFL